MKTRALPPNMRLKLAALILKEAQGRLLPPFT